MNATHHEMLIVGAGLSGLSAAAYLGKSSHSVLVLEKTSLCGGLLNSFTRNGYVFDAGARSIENSGIIKPMLKDLGIELELLDSPVSIGIASQIVDMNSKASIAQYRQALETLYPESVDDIRKIFKVIDKVYKQMDVIYGFENPVFKNYRKDRKYLFSELLPWMGKFLLAVSRMESMQQPVEAFLSQISTNRSLNDIIDQHFFKCTPTFFALGYFYVYLDYLYPRGGTGKLAEQMTQKVIEYGGEIQVDTEVVSVHPAKKMVRDCRGNTYTYDKLLWCADLKSLYRNLDTLEIPSDSLTPIEASSAKVLAGRGGDSVFSLFLGVDAPPQKFADITNGHLFYTPSKQGLGETHLSELASLLEKGEHVSKEEILEWVTKYCSLTTYEISIPSLRDASLSPEGKTGLVVSFLLEYDLVTLVESLHWYDEFKDHIEQQMIKTLNQSLFKGLLNKIDLAFSSSPSDIERRFGSSEGGITGWTLTSPSPAINKLLKITKAVHTPIPDVYQCGQWAYSPAGIPTAILTGWYAADAINSQK
jgi:phytoene dehydrogenase-like protein